MTALISSLPLAVGLLAKATLLLLSAALACLLLRRASAAMRHLVWTAALVGVLFLPLSSAVLPSWSVAWGHATATLPAPPPAAPAPLPADTAAPPVVTAPASAPAVMAPADLPIPAPKPTVPAPLVLAVACLAVWLLGTLGLLAHLAGGLFRIGQMGWRAKPLEAGALQIAEAAHQQIGLRRPVRFLRAEADSAVAVPVTWGVLHPVVLLPRQSIGWSEGCLRAALLHEMAHIRRGDWPTQLLARLACALYWWHPLVWGAARQARAESERAADDCVLSAGMTPADYAERLVEVVRSLPLGARPETAAVAMVRPSEVEGRLRAVLARGNSRRPLTRRGLLGSGLAVLILVLPLAALRLTPAAQAQDASAKGAVSGEQIVSADAGVTVRSGYRAVFANGYEVSLVAVTQATRTGDEWDMYGGPWWQPDGTPIGSQSGGISGRQHWTATHTHELTPYSFKISVRPPGGVWRLHAGSEISVFDQFPGSLQPALNPAGGRLADGSAPDIYDGFVSGARPIELYPAGTRSCTVRLGVSSGPWHTAVARPAASKVVWNKADENAPGSYTTISLVPASDGKPEVMCADTQGRKRIFSFAGPTGRLSDVSWKFQAVDRAGQEVSLIQVYQNGDKPGIDLTGRAGSAATPWTTSTDMAQIAEFRLQTRPYQTVEFRNVPLQPAADAAGIQPTSAALLAQASDAQSAQAKALRAHLQPWADANRPLLQQMARAQPGDLAALIRVYDSLQRLPFPLWNGDPRRGHGNENPPFAFNLPSRLTLTHLQRSQTWQDVRIRTDFARYRDLAVSQSVNVGPAHLTLWASGRITRTTAIDGFPGYGKPGGEDESQQEIVPAFFAAPATSGQ